MKNFKNFTKVTAKKQFMNMLNIFLLFCQHELKLKKLPKINFVDKNITVKHKTFGFYKTGEINIAISDRHPIDVLRTLAHELVHYSQHHKNAMLDGSTGSKHENEANKKAGIIMRKFNSKYPELFKMKSL